MDFSTLTASVDLASVSVAILAVAALMVAPNVARYGARKVLSFIR